MKKKGKKPQAPEGKTYMDYSGPREMAHQRMQHLVDASYHGHLAAHHRKMSKLKEGSAKEESLESPHVEDME